MFLSPERPGEKFRRVSNWLAHGWPCPPSQSLCWGLGWGKPALGRSRFDFPRVESGFLRASVQMLERLSEKLGHLFHGSLKVGGWGGSGCSPHNGFKGGKKNTRFSQDLLIQKSSDSFYFRENGFLQPLPQLLTITASHGNSSRPTGCLKSR